MKKIFFLLIVSGTLSANAQTTDTTKAKPSKRRFHTTYNLPGWAIDVNLLGGGLSQKLTTAYTAGNYANGVNVNQGNLKFKDGTSFGFDAQLGYFFGRSRNWGVGAGFMYLSQMGNLTLSDYHAEYQAVDENGHIYRQIVSPNQDIKETVKITNMNIPLVLKYKKRFSERWGITADGGLLFNVKMKNSYNSNASFDYEAAYDIVNTGSGQAYVYDNAVTPKTSDFLITRSFVNSVHPGNVDAFFNQEREAGYGVGLNVKPNSNSGNVSYTTGNIGFIFQPSVNYYLSDYVQLNLGLYYIYQGVNNNAQSGYQLTNKIGDYNSPMNSVTRSIDQSYGLNLGVRIMFGRNPKPGVIAGEDAIAPSKCDIADGMMLLHGFKPGKIVAVGYDMNGIPQADYYTSSNGDGTVRVPNLPAGGYTNITARTGNRTMAGAPLTLDAPVMHVTGQSSTNPTAYGLCDGTIVLRGLPNNELVTVNCDINGVPSAPLYGRTTDNMVVLKGLCGGNYTHIVATVGKCMANNINDITLTTPPAPVPLEKEALVTTPIYFDINITSIHPASISIVETAVIMMKEDMKLNVIVNGYADNTGDVVANQLLSLNRANTVKKYLIAMGISPDRIKIAAHGDKEPQASNDTPEGRALNRCAILKLVKGVNL